jgi:hypothetical protein
MAWNEDLHSRRTGCPNCWSDPRSCCKPWDDVSTTTPFNSSNLDSIFCRPGPLVYGLACPLRRARCHMTDCLIERPCPNACSIAGPTRSRRRTIKRRSCLRRLAPRFFQCCLQLIRGHCPSQMCPDLTLRVDAPMQRDSASQGKKILVHVLAAGPADSPDYCRPRGKSLQRISVGYHFSSQQSPSRPHVLILQLKCPWLPLCVLTARCTVFPLRREG